MSNTEKDFCCTEFLYGFEPIIKSPMQQNSLIYGIFHFNEILGCNYIRIDYGVVEVLIGTILI
jgi:hypothetical protein